MAVLLGSASTAYAQAAAGGAETESPETVIVTAQKIRQRAVDVPITLSVVTGERIRELGVQDLDRLSYFIPGLLVQEQSANNTGFVIRGITSDSGSAQQGPRVTLYYNGVDISRSRGALQDIYDLDRVEVVKGPQATLFGTASTIGAISLVSARPRAGFEAEIRGGAGNFDGRYLSGMLNAGDDTLASRVAFNYRARRGYVPNLAPNQDDLQGIDQLGVRASVRWRPRTDVTADLIFTYDRQRNPGTAFVSRALPTPAGPGNPFGVAFLGGSPVSAATLGAPKLGLTRDIYDANLTVDWKFAERWNLTVINAYRKFDSLEVFDADGSAAWFLEFAEDARGDQFNHETRVSFTGERFRGFAGFNWFYENGVQRVPFSSEEGTFIQCVARPIPNLPCVNAQGVVTAAQATSILSGGRLTQVPYSSTFQNSGRNNQYSGFADATWTPFRPIELTAGVRLLWETRESGYFAQVPRTVLTNAPALIPTQIDTGGQTFTARGSFFAVLPRFNALWRVTGTTNAYGTVSKGRRSPVVQLDAQRVASVVSPRLQNVAEENVWNYEIGLKHASRHLSLGLAGFIQKYDAFQVAVIQPNGATLTQSAGSATNQGVEAEVQLRPVGWLRVDANLSYIDASIDNRADIAPQFRNARFRLTPAWQASGSFTIEKTIGGAQLFFTPSIAHRSSLFFELPNSPAISQGPIVLVNLNGGVRFGVNGARVDVTPFVRNLFNRRFLLDAGNTGGAFGIPSFIPAEPRIWGVQAGVRF